MSRRLIVAVEGEEARKPTAEQLCEWTREDLRSTVLPNVWQKIRFIEVGASREWLEPFVGTVALAVWFNKRDKRAVALDVLDAILSAVASHGMRATIRMFSDQNDVAPSQAEIESHSIEVANRNESVDARIEQQHFIERGQVRRPGPLEPAQVDGQP